MELNRRFEGLQQRPNVPIRCRVRVLGPVTKEKVDKVTISLPLSVFVEETTYEHADLTVFALDISLKEVLRSLQRRLLAINLVNDTNARVPPTLSRPLMQITCLRIDKYTSSRDGREAMDTVLDWTCAGIIEEESKEFAGPVLDLCNNWRRVEATYTSKPKRPHRDVTWSQAGIVWRIRRAGRRSGRSKRAGEELRDSGQYVPCDSYI
jgi:hypothetical protein